MWKPLTDMQQLESIDKSSFAQPQAIFKHSTRCNISADAYEILDESKQVIYYLDLLNYRQIADAIAEKYNVIHKSPQLLIIKDGVCIYNESHWHISLEEFKRHLQ